VLTICQSSTQQYSSTHDVSWYPNFEVNDTAGETATLIIVSNLGIAYPQKQEDPIFPAEKTYDNEWYYNTRWHGGVLGCLDRQYICNPDAQCRTPWSWGTGAYADSEDARVISYLHLSLIMSTMGSSIGYRKATGLDANYKLSRGLSLVLDREQWKVEVLQLFQASLARIQVSARNMARGDPNIPTYGRKDYLDRIPQLREICNMYKFKSTGWRNINVAGFLSAIGGGLFALFLGRTTENEEELRIEGYYRGLREVKWRDLFKDGWNGFVNGFGDFLGWVGKEATKCHGKLKRLHERRKIGRAAKRTTTPHLTPSTTNPRISDGIEADDIEIETREEGTPARAASHS